MACQENQIRKIFERNGIEFLENEGVRRRSDIIQAYQGPDSCDKFFDDMLQEIKDKGGDVLALVQTQDMLIKPNGTTHRSNLERLECLRETADIKCLVPSIQHGICRYMLMWHMKSNMLAVSDKLFLARTADAEN